MALITEVRIRILQTPFDRCVAFASLTVDGEWTVRDIRLIKGSREEPDRLFAIFPRRGVKVCSGCARTLEEAPHNGRVEDVVHPITPVARKKAEDAIVSAYRKQVALSLSPDYSWGYHKCPVAS